MCNRNNICLVSIAISLIVGVLAGIAFFNALLTGITTVTIIALILAAISTIVILLVKGKKEDACLCDIGTCLVVGIAGTIVTGIVALALTLATASVLFAILIGLFGFFAALTLISLVLLLLCLTRINCMCKECM